MASKTKSPASVSYDIDQKPIPTDEEFEPLRLISVKLSNYYRIFYAESNSSRRRVR